MYLHIKVLSKIKLHWKIITDSKTYLTQLLADLECTKTTFYPPICFKFHPHYFHSHTQTYINNTYPLCDVVV